MTLFRRLLAAVLAYLWSGWGAIASLCLFAAAWEWAALAYGPLILPTPGAVLASLARLLDTFPAWETLAISARRAMAGFALALVAGSLLGLLAGLSMTAAMASRPLITLLVGMPPIAWLVLAMLWFGSGDLTPIFTVFIACVPIVFAAAMQGARTLGNELKDMARAYRMPWHMMLTDLYLPHMLSYLFPAWITALGSSWKVVVMAELLSSSDGVGAALAAARSHLDTVATLSWIAAILGLLLTVEYLLLEPIKRQVERWRPQA
ncbi:ABC transporter permease [Kerstersia gyiorum]|uniref:ABC transporter permease n=1 Tax=Kerstersia gyiorum TaxID=206506 RepID=UPI00209E990D|nr:ABC transporter permease subunit [Kerstersia gyiorum]MCP1634346.1 NitT/TauT family transport system permease protein [Kerstersia gyiorum]MCP1638027.1 NitT/TauT family transport system permease protein [Kerstersia gyiorum]MCP1672462.1 NitT/TauT family transport system permease protein [Kerstersia gyiorum]MCP1680149.1 NitT/TauT family transport system permease protein [Kerstersia gyiorum]MCP1683501.1 NitT/TauT family transport system permease protein [Kerstersia gyiorum]